MQLLQVMNKKKIYFLIFGLSLFLMTVHKIYAEPLDQIVAVVNQDVITQSQLSDAMQRVQQQITQGGAQVPTQAVLRKNILNQLIDRSLQMQMAQKLNFKVTDEQVNKAIAQIATENHLSVDQLKQKVQMEGSFTQFKDDIKKQLLLNQVQQAVAGSDVAVTKADIAHFISQYQNQLRTQSSNYHVVDFLVTASSKDEINLAKKQSLTIIKQLQSGASVQQMMSQYPSLQVNDLSWRPLAGLPDLFASKVLAMKKGEVAGPLEAANGVHVIQLEDVQVNAAAAAALPKDKITQVLYQQKLQAALEKWLKKLRATAYIKIVN
jgi:peptidyl-prolyl cis-trans isomerase SurA